MPNRFVTQLAMPEVDDGNSATLGDHVTDEETTPRRRPSRVRAANAFKPHP